MCVLVSTSFVNLFNLKFHSTLAYSREKCNTWVMISSSSFSFCFTRKCLASRFVAWWSAAGYRAMGKWSCQCFVVSIEERFIHYFDLVFLRRSQWSKHFCPFSRLVFAFIHSVAVFFCFFVSSSRLITIFTVLLVLVDFCFKTRSPSHVRFCLFALTHSYVRAQLLG